MRTVHIQRFGTDGYVHPRSTSTSAAFAVGELILCSALVGLQNERHAVGRVGCRQDEEQKHKDLPDVPVQIVVFLRQCGLNRCSLVTVQLATPLAEVLKLIWIQALALALQTKYT
jgi:hypothetical protein